MSNSIFYSQNETDFEIYLPPHFIMKAVTQIPENIYKFSENKSLKALREYIDSTYDLHYSANRFQALEFIEECGHGLSLIHI